MRIVLDTNVLMSGIFFGGVPGRILDAWRVARISLIVSPEILDEYRETAQELESTKGDMAAAPILVTLAASAEVVDAPGLSEGVARDPDDDKFLACALAGSAPIIVSGDLDLQTLHSWKGIRILSPRQFVDEFLADEGA